MSYGQIKYGKVAENQCVTQLQYRSYTYPMTNYYLECIVSMDAAFHAVAICQSGFHTGILDECMLVCLYEEKMCYIEVVKTHSVIGLGGKFQSEGDLPPFPLRYMKPCQ